MAKAKGRVVVDQDNCKGCGVCLTACPTGVLALNKRVNARGYNFSYMANPDECIGCAGCAIVCPDSVITVYREKVNK